jgi:hypothetical protein
MRAGVWEDLYAQSEPELSSAIRVHVLDHYRGKPSVCRGSAGAPKRRSRGDYRMSRRRRAAQAARGAGAGLVTRPESGEGVMLGSV